MRTDDAMRIHEFGTGMIVEAYLTEIPLDSYGLLDKVDAMPHFIPIREFDWEANNMAMQYLTCRFHTDALYLTKHPQIRNLHLIEYPRGQFGECPCALNDLVVIITREG